METASEVPHEPRVGIIYLSIGWSEGDDGGMAFLEPYVRATKKHSLTASSLRRRCRRKRTAGLTTHTPWAWILCLITLRYSTRNSLNSHVLGRARAIGRQRYIEAPVTPEGVPGAAQVAPHLIVGLSRRVRTCQGVDFDLRWSFRYFRYTASERKQPLDRGRWTRR